MAPVFIFVLVLSSPAHAVSPGLFAAGPSDRHKLRVADPQIALEIEQGGGRVIADYGGFKLLEVNSLALQRFGADAAENRDEENHILLNAGAVDTLSEAAKTSRRPAVGFAGRRLHLVQFVGPVKPEWFADLISTGVRVVTYIPHNAYLVYGDSVSLGSLRAMARSRGFVQWQGTYLDGDKIQPRARAVQAKTALEPGVDDLFAIQLVHDPDANDASLQIIQAVKLGPVLRQKRVLGYLNLVVRLPPDQIPVIAALPDVVSIQASKKPRKFDERQDQIVSGNLTGDGAGPTNAGYLAWLGSKGFDQSQFTASGFVVDVTDSGIDNGTNTPNHFGLYEFGDTGQASRVVYNRLEGTPNGGSTIQGCDGHGNLNAHVVGGYNDRPFGFPHTDSAGYHYGLGVCPFVRLASSVIFDPDSFTWPDLTDMIARGYRDGARISSDSWGADLAGDYEEFAQEYDALVRDAQPAGCAVPSNGNQEITIVFAAGNAGSGGQTVGSPATAKNVISVGAAENVHSHSSTNGGNNGAGNDGCGEPDSMADNANDIASFSSRGPCADLRKKPEIVAPGVHITGGVAQQNRVTDGTGNDLSCFAGTGVCALPGGGTPGSPDNFFPTNQQFYTTSSGTSHSTPAVAGGCALVRQYFLNQGLNAPSPAMIKAFLMNSARYMTGVSAGDSLWSNNQGMGGMNLGMAFDGTGRLLRDQVEADVFTASGQSHEFLGSVGDTGKPVRVTLTWTDAPGPTSGNAYLNDLDLTVSIGGKTYKGNVFSGATSATGGTADARNNAESVFLPAGEVGQVVVTVGAANINSDGVPNYGGALDQDFALVVYNLLLTNQPPVISPIGNKAVVTNTLLQFDVIASDPIDTDQVTLWATGIPPWATFGTVSNAGGVTNTFSGTPTNLGSYVTTFFASDKDGTNREIVRIRVTMGELGGGLFISQYYEGAGNNKWIELFNASPSNVNLGAGNYRLGIWSNARREAWKTNGVPTATIPLSSTVMATGLLLVAHDLAISPSYALPPDAADGSLGFSGDDSVILYRGSPYAFSNVVDALGLSATAAMNRSFVRADTVIRGTNTDCNAPDWVEFSLPAVDAASPGTPERLGYHNVVGGASSDNPPILNPIGNQSVTEGDTLQFGVTAVPTEGDAVALAVSGAPAGSSFDSTNENGTFTWAGAGPAGVYTSTFYAVDDDGLASEEVRIRVRPPTGVGPLDIGGWQVLDSRSPSPRVYTFPTNNVLPGQYVIVGRNASRAAFESYYGVTLGTNVLYFNSTNAFPIINTSYAYGLKDDGGSVVDGPSGKGSVVGFATQRDHADADGTESTNWTVRGLALASPGSGVTGNGAAGLVLTELADATNFMFEFVELYYDASWVTNDMDGDGLPDDWENAHFGGLTNTAAGDNDMDDCNNLCEYLADTDPTNSASVFIVDAIMIGGTNLEVRFLGTNSRLYGVEYAPLLPGEGIWSNLQAGIPGTNGLMSVTDTNATPPKFYRGRASVP